MGPAEIAEFFEQRSPSPDEAITPPSGPGLGLEPDRGTLDRFALR